METDIEQHWTLRQQVLREAGSLNEPGLLQELLDFVAELKKRDTPPRRGSVQALMKHFGTISPPEAEEMQAIIKREFNNIEGEW